MVQPRLADTRSWADIVDKIMNDCNSTDPSFKKWLMTKEKLGGTFFNSILWGRLYSIYKSVNTQDRDHFIVIAGKEGSGKSTLGVQIAAVLSEDFKVKNVCFKPEPFITNLENALHNDIKGEVNQLDEGNLVLFSREALGSDNKNMVKIFALMRQLNSIVIICVPNFFTIDTYVRDHRVDTLINIEERGKFTCYYGKGIKIISKEGARFKTIKGIKVPYGTFFDGYFNSTFPIQNDISIETYRNHKKESFKDFIADLKNNYKEIENDLVDMGVATKVLPVCDDTIKSMIKRGDLEGKKIGKKWWVTKESLQKMSFSSSSNTPEPLVGEHNINNAWGEK